MTPERFNRISTVLRKRQPDLTVITDEVHKPRNLAAIVRNCDAVGIDEVHAVVPATGFQIYSGTSASAEKWVDVNYYEDVNAPIRNLKAKGFQLVTANLSADALDYRSIDYTQPTALLMGAEVKGVSADAAKAADHQVVLPMLGMVESYNVSVASALILAEAQTQREKAGLYERNRLPKARYDLLFFRWAHPVLAKFCDDNDIPYPPVREDGEVINLSKWYAAASKS
ncbi:MAG: tRNA (guanosine(18)-2'-O)-methyltransferase TrmH [Agarilytica sp.]